MAQQDTTSRETSKKWSLEECVSYALQHNISIQQSVLDMENSEYNKTSALGNYLPSVNGTATHNWNNGLTQDITTGVLRNQTTANTSIGISAGVNLFNGLQNLNSLHRANLSVLANQYQLDNMKDDIALMVANSFLQILFNKETLKVRQSQYNLTSKDIERTNELISNGQMPQGEIYELEANAASQEQQIVLADNNLRISKISLAQLLLITEYETFDVQTSDYDVPLSEIMDNSADDIYQKALQIRNEVKLSETNVELAEKDYEITRGGALPTLSAFYQYNTRSQYRDVFDGTEIDPENPTIPIGMTETSMETVISPNYRAITTSPDGVFNQFGNNSGHTFGLQLRVPIFNGFSNHVSIQRNRINLEKAKLTLENTKFGLESNIYQAYNDTRGAFKAYEAAGKTLFAREQAFNYAEERFNVGVINSFEFIQTQQALEAAQSEVIRSKFDYIFKLKVLEFYFGIPIQNLDASAEPPTTVPAED